MERWVAKMIAMALIFIIPFICTMLPFKLHAVFARKGEKGKKILSCLMCFGGGVFFATFILHMAPEARGILDYSLMKPNNITYPLPDLLMGGGFFLVFFIEKLVLKWHKKRQQKKTLKRRETCRQFNKLSETNGTNGAQVSAPMSNVVDIEDIMALPKKKEQNKEQNTDNCVLKGTGECCTDPAEMKLSDCAEEQMLPEDQKREDEITSENAHSTRSLVLILALSMHRIFEGMGVGLQGTTHSVWSLFLAIMCHETVIGFALGLQFVNNKFSLRKMLVATILCSFIMPIGVAIGTVLIETGEGGNSIDIINGSLQAVATGTFIYVTFFEILQEEIDPHDTCMSKFFSVLIGFSVMALMPLVPEEGASANRVVVEMTTMAMESFSPQV